MPRQPPPTADGPRQERPKRRPFLLRLPPDLMDELRRWAEQDFRSLNAQIEYLLRDALQRRRRQRPE